MRIKILLVFCLLLALTESSQAQFGIISAIKKKVEKNKEEKMTPEEKAARDQEKREKEMAEIKKRTFPDKKMEDPELEKYLLKLIQQNEKLKSKKVEALHIDNNDWVPTTYSVWDPELKRMSDPKITGVDLKVAIGYRENGYCYRQNVIFKRDALGGGQFQKNGYLQSMWDPEEILCEELDAAIRKDNPNAGNTVSVKPATTSNNKVAKDFLAMLDGTEKTARAAIAKYANQDVIDNGMIPFGKTPVVTKSEDNCVYFSLTENKDSGPRTNKYYICVTNDKISDFGWDVQ